MLRRPGVGQGTGHVRIGLHRPDPGEEVELHAHLQMGGDFGPVGEADVRQSHGSEEDGIRPAGLLEGLVGDVDAGPTIMVGAAGKRFQMKTEPADLPLQGPQHLKAGIHDLVSDAVAGKDGDVKIATYSHSSFPPLQNH